jgi:hypothetical protein
MNTANENITIPLNPNQLRLGRAATPLIAISLTLAAVGLGIGCASVFAIPSSLILVVHAYRTAFAFYLSITLGALFFVMLHHLCRAGWSVTLRRLAEAVCGNFWLMALLFLPLFHARFIVYFAVWGFLAWFFRSRSIRQDSDGDIKWTLQMERLSGPGMIVFALTMLFASVDLLMSQVPHWSSTIFSVYFFSGCVLGFLAALMLLAISLRKKEHASEMITINHLHDLGNLSLGFVIFWGYIAFSQYMLIWYANLPEETKFFLPRQSGPWIAVSIMLLVCQLFLPFFGLLSRHAKRRPAVLAFWAAWLLAAHLLDLYWIVMPNLLIYDSSSNPETPLELKSIMMLLSLVIGMGGMYVANTVRLLNSALLIPVFDPRLAESLGSATTPFAALRDVPPSG